MIAPLSLLGFAFANADLLAEIDASGTIVFATGATTDISPSSCDALTGTALQSLFDPKSASRFARELNGLKDGGRVGPLTLTLASGAQAALSLCRLPNNRGRISCTLSKAGERASLPVSKQDAQTGLATRDAFLDEATKQAEAGDGVSIVSVPGLAEHCGRLSSQDADRLLQRVGESLKAWGAKLIGRLGDNMFGALVERGSRPLGEGMRQALAKEHVSLPVEEMTVAMSGEGLTSEQRMLALRYVIDNFASAKRDRAMGDLSSTFEKMLVNTQVRALQLAKTVAKGAFDFAFMPLVHINTGELAHYECLARFEDQNTGETIQFAEAMGISESFDFAVAARTLSVIEADKNGSHVAFNVSGATLQSPMAFGLIAGILAKKRNLAPRLLIEITETAEISDLKNANAAVQTLRTMGYRVGLDDFGAGVASFQYLQAFTVDFVKFDGALVRKIGTSERDDTLLDGLLKLCRSLNVETIAEGIEDEAMLAHVRELDFDLGQGYLFGKGIKGLAEAQARYEPKAKKVVKRQGVRESWG